MPKLPFRLILASGSPRRRELLREAGYEFEVIPPSAHAEGGRYGWESPSEYVARLAMQKAADVAQRMAADSPPPAPCMLLGCDTVAEWGGQILGKPVDEQHAGEILRTLSGREHHVYSGLCLWPLQAGQPRVEVAVTRLQMQRLTEKQLSEYLDSGLWEGKAGAFGYQDRLGWLTILEGSESNVVGLPLELLETMLTEQIAARQAGAQSQQQQ